MTVELARERLRAVVDTFEGARLLLVGLRATLPLPRGKDQEDPDADPDPASEMHAVIGCSLHDSLDPLIRDLRALAEYRPGASRRRSGQTLFRKLDLATFDEEARRVLREIVIRDNFTPRHLDGSDDLWTPPYTAEQASLEIFWSHGRWFATWLKLEEPEDLPETERRELLLLEEDEAEPGTLVYREV